MNRFFIYIIVLAVLIAVISGCFYQVDNTQFCILTHFGKPVEIKEQPGLYMKWPWPVQQANRLDKRTQIYETRLIEYLTGDKKNIILQAFCCWSVKEPLAFFKAVRTVENANQALDDILCSRLGSTLGELSMSQLISTKEDEVKISEMEARISREANQKVSNEGYGFQIEHVGVSRLALSEENAQSVYRRMRAERASIANEYRALGKEEADKIRSDADRERSEILANAYRDSEIIKGEGEAQAAKIYSEAYSRSPEFFELLRSLEAYKRIIPGNTTLVLPANSDLLKYLSGPGPVASSTHEAEH